VDDPRAGSIRRTDGSTGVWHSASLQDGPRWAPFFINYGLPVDQWTARFREQGFPKDPWVLQGVTAEVPDPAASASWLADLFALDVVRIGQDAITVPLPGCAITFAAGPADRITAVILTGPGAPKGSVAGLRYLDAGPETSHRPCEATRRPLLRRQAQVDGRVLDVGAVRDGGRVISIILHGLPAELERGITGQSFAAHGGRERLEALSRLVDAGTLRPQVEAVLPLDQARKALTRVAGRHTRGKIVLQIGQ
jgi:hypothetical protein